MIPKVVHLTYKCKDPNKLPERCKKCYKSIQTWFGAAGYRIVFADDTDMHKAVLEYDKELFQLYQQQPIITKTDIWRLVVLYTQGGYYMDTDVFWKESPIVFLESCKSENILCENHSMGKCCLNHDTYPCQPVSVGNYFMGCRKGSPFFKFLLKRLIQTLHPKNELLISANRVKSDNTMVYLVGFHSQKF